MTHREATVKQLRELSESQHHVADSIAKVADAIGNSTTPLKDFAELVDIIEHYYQDNLESIKLVKRSLANERTSES